MRPDVYFYSYKRYKNGINRIALWLANSATEHKIAFEKSGDKSKYILPLAELSRLASALTNASNVAVPKTFINDLKDVLSLRKEASRIFKQGRINGEGVFQD
jgi:hypothetical protein